VDVIEPPVHHPVCGECGARWPCADYRHQRRVEHYNHQLERMCPACLKPVENGHMSAVVEGRRYHMAKRHRRCRAAALALDPRLRVVYD
jgi:hypothetical protein